MATVVWTGQAAAVPQVGTFTITGNDVTTTYKITINNKVISVLGNAGGVNSTASDLQAALAATTAPPEFQEVTWTVSTATITATAATAGKPFTATSSVSGGTGTIGSYTAVTASAGPSDWSTAGNWSTNAVPVSTDDVYFTNSSVSVLYGLDQHTVTLNSLTIDSTYTGTIGLPRNTVGPNNVAYVDYRPRYLQVGATTVTIGAGSGSGSSMLQLDQYTAQTTWVIYSTGSASSSGLPAVTLKGTHASNVLDISKGSVGVAIEPGDVSTIATINTGYVNSQTTDVTLTLGSGCTLTTINQDGGNVTVQSNVTTWNVNGGTANLTGSAPTVITLKLLVSGTFNFYSGTITTATVDVACTLDASKDARAKTITNATVYGALLDPAKVVTYTNPVSFPNGVGGNNGATLSWGTGFSLARS